MALLLGLALEFRAHQRQNSLPDNGQSQYLQSIGECRHPIGSYALSHVLVGTSQISHNESRPYRSSQGSYQQVAKDVIQFPPETH